MLLAYCLVAEVFWLVVQHIFMQLLSSCLLARVMAHGQMDFFACFITQHMNHVFYISTFFFSQKDTLCHY